MFETIKELVTEAIGDGMYEEEFAEALEAELLELGKMEREAENCREDSETLDALRAAGVDNWEGFDFAMDIKRGDA